MADLLYIGHPTDDPHASRGDGFTKCGWSMAGFQGITEATALVYLGDRRCHVCFPFWNAKKGQQR